MHADDRRRHTRSEDGLEGVVRLSITDHGLLARSISHPFVLALILPAARNTRIRNGDIEQLQAGCGRSKGAKAEEQAGRAGQ